MNELSPPAWDRKYLQITCLIKDEYPKYTKKSFNSIRRWQATQLKNGQNILLLIWPDLHCYHKEVIVKKPDDGFFTIKVLATCRENWTFIHSWWECKMVQLLWKRLWQLLKKLSINVIPFLSPREIKTFVYTKSSMQAFIPALFRRAENWK